MDCSSEQRLSADTRRVITEGTIFVALDVHKKTIAVATVEGCASIHFQRAIPPGIWAQSDTGRVNVPAGLGRLKTQACCGAVVRYAIAH